MAKRSTTKKAVATREEAGPPAEMFDGMPDGWEETTGESFQTPFLKILEQLSPECDRKKGVEGAEPGKFFHTATGEVSDTINVIVLKPSHQLVAWKPNRGGFAGRYSKLREKNVVDRREPDSPKKWDADGNELVDTMEFYLVEPDKPGSLCVFPLSVTRFKAAKMFNNRLAALRCNGKRQPPYAGVWELSTMEMSNENGTWHTLAAPRFVRWVTREDVSNVIQPALDMLETAQVNYKDVESDEAETGSEDY